MYFHLTNKQKQTHDSLLDIESVARDSWSSPPSMNGRACSMDGDPIHGFYPHAALSIIKTLQAFYFVPLSSPRPPFQYYWPTPPVDFSFYPWIFRHETGTRIHQ